MRCAARPARGEAPVPAQFLPPGIISKQDNFYIAVQQHPAFQRIALNNAVVAQKRFRVRKKRNHVVSATSKTLARVSDSEPLVQRRPPKSQ
jgi:hypothetical protein